MVTERPASTTVTGPKKLGRDTAGHVEFGAHLEPALRVRQGEIFAVETLDNWFDSLNEPGARPDLTKPPIGALQVFRANPVNGPIHVEGAEPGDALRVHIHDIAIRDWGWTGMLKARGMTGTLAYFAEIDEDFATIIRHVPGPSGTFADGEAVMDVGREVRWPLAPFIGVIATAPERGVENTVISQGAWGGNLDVRDVSAGNVVELNSAHEGGLLFVGDVHASQGDSEFTGIANETAAELLLSVEVMKGRQIPGALRIEKPNSLVQVESARNAGGRDRALTWVFINMIRWLVEDYGMSKREAVLHMTANSLVRTHIYQNTSGAFCCGVEFPKSCV